MTIVHHAGKGGVSERMESQAAFARLQYARKYFGPLHRTAFMGSVGLRYALRAAMPGDSDAARRRRAAARAALRVLTGRDAPPFGVPPNQALRLEADRAGTSRR